jgi:arginine deiminase
MRIENRQTVGRRKFLTASAGCLTGIALSGITRASEQVSVVEQLQTTAGHPSSWVSSDIATLRRVIISPPNHNEGFSLASGSPQLEPWIDREDWLREHAIMRGILETNGVQVLTFERVLDEAIEAGRKEGLFHTWLKAVAPSLSREEKEITALGLMGAAQKKGYPRDDDGNYRHIVDADSVIWPRDVAVMLPTGLLICNFANEDRAFSSQLMRFMAEFSPSLSRYPVVLDAVEEGVRVEGGDVLVVDSSTLLVGFGSRTEAAAPRFLARRLNMNVIAVQIGKGEYAKHWNREDPFGLDTMFLHLDSCCTLVNDKHVVVLPWFLEQTSISKDPFSRVLKGIARHPRVKEEEIEKSLACLHDVGNVKRYLAGSGEIDPKISNMKLVDYLRQDGYRISYVGGTPPPDSDMDYFFDVVWREHLSLAANVVATSPGHILSFDNCPKTHDALRNAGIDVLAFPGEHLRLGYGGPHCLTLPLERG